MKHTFLILLLLFTLSVSTLRSQIITTFAGNGFSSGGYGGYGGDGGNATAAMLNAPIGIAFDKNGNLYIGDQVNHRIRKVDTFGTITTVAGTGFAGFSGDGGPATNAKLNYPYSVAVDSVGNIFVGDANNQRIRKIDTLGIITTFAGTGLSGITPDGIQATASRIDVPGGIAIASGNVYVSEVGHNVVRKIDTSGIITTVAGVYGVSGSFGDGGLAIHATLYNPTGLGIDNLGNLFIVDAGNNKIRKIDTSGIITTFAGIDTGGFSGDGGQATAAKLYNPFYVAFDSNNVYITDERNNRVRRVNHSGVITTFAGSSSISGFSGDGGPATNANFNGVAGIAVNAGYLYIADIDNHRIRRVSIPPVSESVAATKDDHFMPTIFPNPSHGSFTITWSGISDEINIVIEDMVGRTIQARTIYARTNKAEFDLNNAPPGTYVVKILTPRNVYTKQIVIW